MQYLKNRFYVQFGDTIKFWYPTDRRQSSLVYNNAIPRGHLVETCVKIAEEAYDGLKSQTCGQQQTELTVDDDGNSSNVLPLRYACLRNIVVNAEHYAIAPSV